MKMMQSPADRRCVEGGKRDAGSFGHLKLLLYWPIFGLLFLFVERLYPVKTYISMYCPLDDLIPFNEFFLIPYLFWFVFLIGIHLYTMLYDVEAFKKLMKFIMITYTATIVIYLLFPTCQELRPVTFERDNAFTRFLYYFYRFDTSTNVCPSLHVIGSFAVVFTAWHTKRFQSPGWKAAFGITGLLICVSTVFLKQHSVIDVLAALPICLAAYLLCFPRKAGEEKPLKKKMRTEKS